MQHKWGEKDAYRLYVENPEAKWPLRITSCTQVNKRWILDRTGSMDWIDLVYVRGQWRAFLNAGSIKFWGVLE
jgi:hypothetical protein